jgi:hypothetical protein
MSFPSRVVLYLKPPVPGAAAQVTVKKYDADDQPTTEHDITTTGAGLQSPTAANPVRFNLRAINGSRAIVWGPPVDWPGGCRAYLSAILGEAGDTETDITGLDYTGKAPVNPCTDLICAFDDAGVLTMEDNRGVKITMDLKLPGRAALCLTLIPEGHLDEAEVTFPSGHFATQYCQH